ncbi:MAG: cyclodeaminase/cyclohydrolase family protein [Clostridiales bacterium]|nr:cyclodeaminase/cyclohydrolase family protein [Clostridiales bacterium]
MEWKDCTLSAFADALAQPGHAPAGGSACALAAGLAAALCAMTAGLAVKAGHPDMQPLVEEAHALRAQLMDCVHQDTDAFGAYMQARRAASTDAAAADDALVGATLVPLTVARHAHRIIAMTRLAVPHCPPAARPDGLAGIALGQAARSASLLNARANAARLVDENKRAQVLGWIAGEEQKDG